MDLAEQIADAKDIVGDMKDLAQTWTNAAGTVSWQVLMGQPILSQELTAGGYKEHMMHEIMLVASQSAWTTSYGSACAAAVASNAPVSDLQNGKVLIATEQGNKKYRVQSCSYMPGSGWVALRVTLDSDF